MTADIAQIFSFKAAIFDLDGTLIDSEEAHLTTWQYVCRKYGLPPMTMEYMRNIGGMSSRSICERMCRENGRSDIDTQAMANEKTGLYRSRYMQTIKLFPFIASVLQQAHVQGMKTAVATGSRMPATRFVLEKHGLLKSIDTIVTSEQIKNVKPAPETYLLCAQRLKVAPRECVAFEDTELGMQGIKAAGMTGVRVFADRFISDLIRP